MKTILLLISLLISSVSLADAWDNLTFEEAQNVATHLEYNPFIFDYCDCCDHSGEFATKVYLIKVTGTKIVTCEWNTEYYSVQIEGYALAELKYTASGVSTKKLLKTKLNEPNSIITMNYTWTQGFESLIAVPFFEVVDYHTYGDDNKPCKKHFKFPTPKAFAKVSDDPEYAVWYQENVKSK